MTSEIALFPLNTVLFPGGPLRLRIFETRYVDMVRRCLREQSAFGVVLIRAGVEAGEVTEVADVGTSARIVDFYRLPDGLLGLSCSGERRFRIVRRWRQVDGLNLAAIDWLPDDPQIDLPEEYAHLRGLVEMLLPQLGDLYDAATCRFDDAAWLGYRLAEILPIRLTEKQSCLEMDDPLARLARLSPIIPRVPE